MLFLYSKFSNYKINSKGWLLKMKKIFAENRKKTNLGFYKEVCILLEEQEFKKNSLEKEEQLKRWESEESIFKNKDNSFTYINKNFKSLREIDAQKSIVQVENHEVFIGRGKFSSKKIKNINTVFLDYIQNSNFSVLNKYIIGFWKDSPMCELVKEIEQEKLKNKDICDDYEKKINCFVCDLFKSKAYDFFTFLLNKNREYITEDIYFVDGFDKKLDFEICSNAKKQACEELKISSKDKLKCSKSIDNRANKILREKGEKEFFKKKTIYSIKDADSVKEISSYDYVYTMTLIYEVMRNYILRVIDEYKKEIALGTKTFDLKYAYYKMSREELSEAGRIIERKLIFVDLHECAVYRTIEDIPKTEFEQ